jgi:hypothetical protein
LLTQHFHTGEVVGSIPTAPTIISACKAGTFRILAGIVVRNSQQNAARTCATLTGKIRGICSLDVRGNLGWFG